MFSFKAKMFYRCSFKICLLKGLKADFRVTHHAKMATPDLPWYPWNFCLLKSMIEIFAFLGFLILFSCSRNTQITFIHGAFHIRMAGHFNSRFKSLEVQCWTDMSHIQWTKVSQFSVLQGLPGLRVSYKPWE